MKIHHGTKFNGTIPCRWVEPRTIWQWDLDELITGLCSKYGRIWGLDEEPTPDHLTADQIISIVKEQYEYYGTSSVWAWADAFGDDDEAKAVVEAWARRMIRAVLPDLEVPKD